MKVLEKFNGTANFLEQKRRCNTNLCRTLPLKRKFKQKSKENSVSWITCKHRQSTQDCYRLAQLCQSSPIIRPDSTRSLCENIYRKYFPPKLVVNRVSGNVIVRQFQCQHRGKVSSPRNENFYRLARLSKVWKRQSCIMQEISRRLGVFSWNPENSMLPPTSRADHEHLVIIHWTALHNKPLGFIVRVIN